MNIGKIVPNHFFEMPFHFIRQDIEGPFGIVGLAIIPYKLNMVESLFDSTVLSCFKLVLDLQKVHWVFDDEGVILELQLYFEIIVHSQSTGWRNSVDSGRSIR